MSGSTKPSERLRENVEPAVSEYLQNPLSRRHANALAGALNDHLEWTYKYYQQVNPSRLDGATLRSFRTDLLKQHRSLQVMSDLADAAHHRYLDRAHVQGRIWNTTARQIKNEARLHSDQVNLNSPFKFHS
jgi:hypothetical protein